MIKFNLGDLPSQVTEEAVSIVPEMVPGRVCHIDGDFLAYFAAGGDNLPPNIVRQIVRDRCEKFRVMTGSEKVLMHLTDSRSTKGDRYIIGATQPYQGQRLSGKKPANWRLARDYIESGEHGIALKFWKTREADDGMAFCAERSAGLDAVCTKDKDMRMFAGLHCEWDTFQLTQVNPGDYRVLGPVKRSKVKVFGHVFFWMQMLMGDTADNIPGCYRMGSGRAEKALRDTSNNSEAFDVVLNLYKKHYGEEAHNYMVEQAALLWMRTDRDADLCNFTSIFPKDSERKIPVQNAALALIARVNKEKQELEDILNAKFYE